MLLVADDEPGFSEAYSLGNQRVRAYDELQRAVRERRRDLPFFRRFGGSGEQPTAVSESAEHRHEIVKVLRREDFRRRHESTLITVLHGDIGGSRRDGGFSAADVSGDETHHRALR